MAGTTVSDNLLLGGTNQGVERSILPLPQLDLAFNVRMRKGSRWGKRYGHTALSTTNLGNGTGNIRAAGGADASAFCITDDVCSSYDRTAAAFTSSTAVTSAYDRNRVRGAVSGWVPDTSFFPLPISVLSKQTTTGCSSCFALGYLWTAIELIRLGFPTDRMIRIAVTDPTDQTLIKTFEILSAATGFGGIRYPKLIACGSTVVLVYLNAPSAGVLKVNGRTLTSLSGGFSADTNIDATAVTAFDASGYSSTQFLVAAAPVAGAAPIDLVNATGLGIASSKTIVDGGGLITSVSIVGSATLNTFLGYGVTATTSTKVAVYGVGFGAFVATGTITVGSAVKPLLALLPGSSVRVVAASSVVTTVGLAQGSFLTADVSAAGAVSASVASQAGLYPLSMPFVIGSSAYIWTKTEVTSDPGYPTLIRLAPPVTSGVFSAPLEMSVQDYIVNKGTGASVVDLSGLPFVSSVAAGVYAVPVPVLALKSTATSGCDFRVLQAKHFTIGASSRSAVPIGADSCSFVPIGALTRVDDRGAVEEGFIGAPSVGTVAAGAAGALTPSSTYYYSLTYRARSANGRYEESAPSIPVSVALGAGNNSASFTLSTLAISARPSVEVWVYRTLANGQTFYLSQIVDSDPSAANISIVDTNSDTTIATQQALYVQVGQTLPNVLPPPSRFGCVGGQRLFLGGLMRPDVVQASKLIFGDQSPSFADSDAFRIVLPGPCTGIAWMDTLCMFTAEGIYIASGDGPDDSGVGDFGNLTRMPYELGCIEPRSIKVVDDGCFFQTSRGLYLLPRGFGAPVPAGDNVLTSLASFPVITGVATVTKTQEQSVVWTCANSGGSIGVRLAYDLAHKVWSVDNFADSSGSAAAPCGIGQWIGGEIAQFGATTTQGLQASNGTFADANNTAITMEIRTGDIRPFGASSEGVLNKLAMLAELRSACTLNITKTTETASFTSSRVFALAAGDTQVGSVAVTETELGSTEQRNAMALTVQYDETSTSEGVALIALSLEHEKGEGLKRLYNLSRNT